MMMILKNHYHLSYQEIDHYYIQIDLVWYIDMMK